MATIDQLLRDEPKDNNPAAITGPQGNATTSDDPCCTPPPPDPGPDQG